MNKEEFEKFITLESYFKDVFFYEDSQSICHEYQLEDFYPDMIKLYSTDNKYFPLILLNKHNKLFLVDRDNDLVELENNIYYLPFYLFITLYVEDDTIEVTILCEKDKVDFLRQCENLKSFFKWIKEENIILKNLEELEKLIKNIELYIKNKWKKGIYE